MLLDHLYRVARPFLFRLDPERVHDLIIEHAPKLVPLAPPVERRPRWQLGRGLTVPSQVGLAAGMDKDAKALELWERLGFGYVEVGTVLPRPQKGNPKPRIKRQVKRRALINSMGFPSEGMVEVAKRLEVWKDRPLRSGRMKLGINIGKNANTSLDEAYKDYASVAARLGRYADYLAVNVSSPNTPGLRRLGRAEALKKIIGYVQQAAPRDIPVWVKLSPDAGDDELVPALEAAIAEGVAGFIATNTTRSVMHQGGVSGEPLYPLARATIHKVLEVCSGKAAVIGCGGIHYRQQVEDLIAMGCAGVQLLTGLIYEGPGLPRRVAPG